MVLLNDQILPGDSLADTLAPVQAAGRTLVAAITETTIQTLAASVISIGGTGSVGLPDLVAQVALRAAAQPQSNHYLTIAAPRYVDPSPRFATAAILATARAFWSTGVPVSRATSVATPVSRGAPVPPASTPQLPEQTIDAARQVRDTVPRMRSMFDAAAAVRILGPLPVGTQRSESSALVGEPDLANAYAAGIDAAVTDIQTGVSIVKPTVGTYTLASQNAPLPITLANTLDVPVQVHLDVEAVNSVPGFSAGDTGLVRIPANNNVTVRVPVQLERSGRFAVIARLFTPARVELGTPVTLSVHSTALGTVGIVITAVAGGVLLLALVLRYSRRARKPPVENRPEPAPPRTPADVS
jgi:hypothetical protein